MRRVALYGLGWLFAATAAVLLAWQGVGRVGTSVTERHARVFTADEARAALEESGADDGGGGAPASTTSSSTSAGGGAPDRATTTTTPRPTRPTTTPSTTSRPGVSVPSPTVSTQPPGGSPTTSTTTAAGVVRTYNLTGGSATLRFEPTGKVVVVWANPNPGYRVEVDDRSDGGVRVRFDGDSHRSELEAWWDGGPRERIEER